jgi:ABC-type phosphate transport system substrate-binding protein
MALGARWTRRLTTALLAGIIGLGVAPSLASPASASGVPIIGVSDLYPGPAARQWSAQVDGLYGDQVNVTTASSEVALNEYAAGLLNFGVTTFPYGHSFATNYLPSPPYTPYQYVPLVGGADCMAFNVTDTTGSPVTTLRLDAPTLAGIFTGTITMWNDPALTALNPGVALPDTSIVPVVRSDTAMESYVLSVYLHDNALAAWHGYTTAIGAPPNAQGVFPVGTAGIYQAKWSAQSGILAEAAYVRNGPGAVGYLPPAYASLDGLTCASVKNSSGFFTQPTADHVTDALRSTVLRSDTSANPHSIIGSRHPGAYPLSFYAMAVTQTSQTPPAVGATLGAFLKFAVCQGQSQVTALGYAALPPSLVKDAFDAIRRINGADPGPLTPANCPQPVPDRCVVAVAAGSPANRFVAALRRPASASSSRPGP